MLHTDRAADLSRWFSDIYFGDKPSHVAMAQRAGINIKLLAEFIGTFINTVIPTLSFVCFCLPTLDLSERTQITPSF